MKTFFIRTYGCQMNELDSEMMKGLLEKRGLVSTDDEMEADLILYNTCSIRDLAERKALGKLGQLIKRRARKPIIGITGCMASSKKEALFHKLPNIDFVLGTNNIHELNSLLDDILKGHTGSVKVDERFSCELDYNIASREDAVKAYVSIIRGCNNHCTYCVVPYTRGPEVSRSVEDILYECSTLIDKGYKEITLLGQNVDSFGKDHPEWKTRFSDLLYQLDAIANKSCRIRFMTSHPVDITEDLMTAVRDLPSVCESVHFPLQAGSNRILKKMNRRYTKEEYFEKVSRVREIVPSIALGTDIIVGFPTETDAEFEETRHALETLHFSFAFIFIYSPRKGTPAFRFGDDIPKAVKEARHQTLLRLQEQIYRTQREKMIGSTVEVLVEGPCSKESSQLHGRTRCWKNVVFDGPLEYIGTFQQIHLTGISHQTLLGESPVS